MLGVVRYTISSILVFSFLSIQSAFFDVTVDDEHAILWCGHLSSEDFIEAAVKLPFLLDKAKEERRKVIITIPSNIEGHSSVDVKAAHIEAARVALAWGSAYFRFGETDVRVLRVDQEDGVGKVIGQLVTKKIPLDQTISPEDQFEQRIFTPADFTEIKNAEIKQKQVMVRREKPGRFDPQFLPQLPNQKRIVVAGGAGFLGSHLVRALLERGHQVVVLDNYFCCNKNNLSDCEKNPNLRIYYYDISWPVEIRGALDWVVDLASVPSPVDYYRAPYETLRCGIHGVGNMLELAESKNARFFFSSTSEVYGDPEISPQHERYVGRVNPYGKRSQYDESKRGAEMMVSLYFNNTHRDVRIARIFNTYGPGMRLGDGRVVTNFIQAIMYNQPATIYGDGNQTRSFAYVTDTVDGLLRLLETDEPLGDRIEDRIFNVGNPGEFTINELAQEINALSLRTFGRPVEIKHVENSDKTDPKLRKPDISKIKSKLGYQPQVSLLEGLEKTLMYFMNQE